MTTRTVRTIGVAAPFQPAIFSYEEDPPRNGEIRVETLYTGLSAGTELTFVKGTNPYLHASWDADRGVFLEGVPARHYPVEVLGYMEVARVTESRNHAVDEGALVALNYGHRTGHVIDPARAVVTTLPESLDPLLGIYVAQMGPICVNGLLHAAAEETGSERSADLAEGVRGRNVLVTGGGVVGLLTGVFARLRGAAEVALADADPQRLAAAEHLGLTPVPDDGSSAVWQWCKERWRHGPGDAGADTAFQCRGQAAVLSTALRALRPQGTVVDLAFYQGGCPELRLGEEFHHNGLAIRCAQIGRVPRGQSGSWDRRRLAAETLQLLAECADAVRSHVITDVAPFDDGPRLMLELAERRRSLIQAVFAVEG